MGVEMEIDDQAFKAAQQRLTKLVLDGADSFQPGGSGWMLHFVEAYESAKAATEQSDSVQAMRKSHNDGTCGHNGFQCLVCYGMNKEGIRRDNFERTQQPDELAALQKFKDYVHKRLDDAEIPSHPDGKHSKHGCRIGDRLDIALGLIEREASKERYQVRQSKDTGSWIVYDGRDGDTYEIWQDEESAVAHAEELNRDGNGVLKAEAVTVSSELISQVIAALQSWRDAVQNRGFVMVAHAWVNKGEAALAALLKEQPRRG